MTRIRTALLAALLPLAAACRDGTPTGPDAAGADLPGYSINDAGHMAGVPQFFWLPPTVPNPGPSVTGTFDDGLLGAAGVYPQLEVRVCPGGVTTLCPASGAGSLGSFNGFDTAPAITMDAAKGNYQLLWNPNGLAAGSTYRSWVLAKISANANPLPLGYADVKVVATSKQLKQVNPNDYVGLVAGNPLYLKFTVRTGIAGAVSVALGTSVLVPGGTTTATATVTDLHGDPLAGAPVSWAVTPANSPPGTITPASSTTDVDGEASATLTAGGSAGTGAVTATVGTTPGQLTGSANFSVVTAGGLVAGGNHTCGITSTGETYCWGSNYWGELGNGSNSPTSTPSAVTLPNGVNDFARLALGFSHSCALTATSAVYCWGADDFYQLGYDDNYADSPVPVAVNVGISGPFTGFDAYGGHSCVLNTAGAIYCWGDLGPQETGFASVAAGGLHHCGITSGGVAKCWGQNVYGQLGDGSDDNSWVDPVAVAVSAGVTFTSISSGGFHSCALTSTGAAYCWGHNLLGQLGNNSTTSSDVPVQVSLPAGVSLVSLTLGSMHSCGLTATGAAWCWGENYAGQLGDGSTTASSTPVAVSLPGGVTGFASLSAGSMHTCGIASTGAGYCWGKNDFGQLGDGTTTSSSTPQQVGGGLTFQTP
jgi:alpha-tubulin suppressor-like RCC1 family protein